MRLFHISQEESINKFIPRTHSRDDLDKTKKFVWSITEQCLPNYLTPRDCPRVTYHCGGQTTQEDIQKFFSSTSRHCVAIESSWYKQMCETTLYLYEFDISNFYLLDECAGYYVSENIEIPVSITKIDNLFDELIKRNVEIRILDELWTLSDEVKKSTLNWSFCRMRNARPKI